MGLCGRRQCGVPGQRCGGRKGLRAALGGAGAGGVEFGEQFLAFGLPVAQASAQQRARQGNAPFTVLAADADIDELRRCGWLRYWLIASINCDSSLATAEAANTRPSDKPAKRSADEIKRMGIPFELTAPMMREVTLFRATDFPSVVGSGAIISLLH
ncbi:hypothetical protein D3C76_1098440 [compost metagenome]